MKLRNWITALLVCSSGLLLHAAEAATGWKLLANQGARYFVAVDAGQQADPAVLRQAATALCGVGKACVVMFWSDASLAATRMPLTPAQHDALVAQYSRNPASGHDDLLFRCPAGSAAATRCLK